MGFKEVFERVPHVFRKVFLRLCGLLNRCKTAAESCTKFIQPPLNEQQKL